MYFETLSFDTLTRYLYLFSVHCVKIEHYCNMVAVTGFIVFKHSR